MNLTNTTDRHIEHLVEEGYTGKFFVRFTAYEGCAPRWRVAYFIPAGPYNIIKFDGAHLYFWYRDQRLNRMVKVPKEQA